jgi:glucose/mannose-6-phosphate isomerase
VSRRALDTAALARADPGGMWRHVATWPDQWARQRLLLAEEPWPPLHAAGFDQLAIGGLGGSAIAGDVAYGVAQDDFPLPLRVVRDYRWPGSVGGRSLCLLSSYSGDTEETLSLYDEAGARGARRLVLTSGGKLAERAERDGARVVSLPPGLPPRAALGYSLVAVLALLRALGWPGGGEAEQDETGHLLAEGNALFGGEVPEAKNPAKAWARELAGRLVVLYAPARPLWGVGLRWKGQINENAKAPAYASDLPEMNHNEIVSWHRETVARLPASAIFLRDGDEHPRVARRLELTRSILEAEGVRCHEARGRGASRLARLVTLVQFGDWMSLYLAALAGVDPMRLEKIDAVKEKMGASR